jgi:hypothetical protein
MRDIVIFLLVLAAVFIGVGEWRGWYLGVPGSTPVVVYKMDHRAVSDVRTVTRADMPIAMDGRVRRGTVTVQVTHERPVSFQTGGDALPERVVFEQVYRAGQRVNLNQTFEAGRGIYRVRVTYADVTGTFTFRWPPPSQL